MSSNCDGGRRALVIGGGVGGLSAAVALRRIGWDPVVFERAADNSGLGAGLHLWSNAVLALDELQLGVQVRAVAPPQDWAEFGDSSGATYARWPIGEHVEKLGAPVVAISRRELSRIAYAALPGGTVRVGADCVGYRVEPDCVVALFADGTQECGDVLIGADGLHSAIRSQLLGAEPARYTGYAAWRAVIDISEARVPPGKFRLSYGRGTRFVSYHVGPDRLHWMSVANVTQGSHAGQDPLDVKAMLLERHRGWHEPVEEILEATPAASIIWTDVFDRKPVQRWGAGRVTLLGDAAHPMTFNIGQGAGTALEDSIVLAHQLSTAPDVVDGLRAYESARQPRTASMVNASAVLGRLGSWSSPAGRAARRTVISVGWERFAYKKVTQDAAYGLTLRGVLPPAAAGAPR